MEEEALRILKELCRYLDGGPKRKVVAGSPLHEQIKNLLGENHESKAKA